MNKSEKERVIRDLLVGMVDRETNMVFTRDNTSNYLVSMFVRHQIPFSTDTIFEVAYEHSDMLKAQVVLRRLTGKV